MQLTNKKIAEKFEVSRPTIDCIAQARTWRDAIVVTED
jgi:hypothetical protein